MIQTNKYFKYGQSPNVSVLYISITDRHHKFFSRFQNCSFLKIKKRLCKIFKIIEIISKEQSQINFEVARWDKMYIFFFEAQNYMECSSNLSKISKTN